MAALFAPFEKISEIQDGELVTTHNTSEARWALDPATGRRWVRKCESNSGFEALLAEAVAWRVGKLMGVPTPHAAIFADGTGQLSWLSEMIPAALLWDHSKRDYIVNLQGLATMVLLDSIIYNDDRHAGNILLQPFPDESKLKVWAIDSGSARVGWIDDFLQCGSNPPDPRNHARGLPLDAIAPLCESAANRARKISHGALRAICTEACALVREPPSRADALANALHRRVLDAPGIICEYLEALEALR